MKVMKAVLVILMSFGLVMVAPQIHAESDANGDSKSSQDSKGTTSSEQGSKGGGSSEPECN